MSSGGTPVAAFFARTYVPSRVSEVSSVACTIVFGRVSDVSSSVLLGNFAAALTLCLPQIVMALDGWAS